MRISRIPGQFELEKMSLRESEKQKQGEGSDMDIRFSDSRIKKKESTVKTRSYQAKSPRQDL